MIAAIIVGVGGAAIIGALAMCMFAKAVLVAAQVPDVYDFRKRSGVALIGVCVALVWLAVGMLSGLFVDPGDLPTYWWAPPVFVHLAAGGLYFYDSAVVFRAASEVRKRTTPVLLPVGHQDTAVLDVLNRLEGGGDTS